MKKQYFYDYKTTTSPIDHSHTAPADSDVTLGHGEVIIPETTTRTTTTTQTVEEPQTGGFDPLPSERRRIPLVTPVTAGLLLAVLVLSFLVYRNRPQTFQACSNLPGSKVEGGYPQVCTTLYGAKFVQNTFGSIADSGASDTNDGFVPELEPLETSNETTDEGGSVAGATTKGGLPVPVSPTPAIVPTLTPTITQTPQPTSAPIAVTADVIKHRYPQQGFSLMLPRSWKSSNATLQTQTNITTIKMWDDNANAPEMMIQIQPNWDNTGDAKNQAINFDIAGISTIKVTSGIETKYYFERSGNVYVITCANHAVDVCERAIKTLNFSN